MPIWDIETCTTLWVPIITAGDIHHAPGVFHVQQKATQAVQEGRSCVFFVKGHTKGRRAAATAWLTWFTRLLRRLRVVYM